MSVSKLSIANDDSFIKILGVSAGESLTSSISSVSFSSANWLSYSRLRSDSKCFFIMQYRWLLSCYMSRVAFACNLPRQSTSIRRLNPLCLGFYFYSNRPWDSRFLFLSSCGVSLHSHYCPPPPPSQYGFFIGLTNSGSFEQPYLQTRSRSLSGFKGLNSFYCSSAGVEPIE